MREIETAQKVLRDKCEPNEIAIEDLHASIIRLMTEFAFSPSPCRAYMVIRMLEALAQHGGTDKAKTGNRPYHSAIAVWVSIVNNMSQNCSTSNVQQSPTTELLH